MMIDQTEQRLIALESRLSHHERITEDLSSVVADQARIIDKLTAQILRMREQLGDMAAGWSPSSQDEKPPPHF